MTFSWMHEVYYENVKETDFPTVILMGYGAHREWMRIVAEYMIRNKTIDGADLDLRIRFQGTRIAFDDSLPTMTVRVLLPDGSDRRIEASTA